MTIASKFARGSTLVALSLPWTIFIGTVAKEDRDVLLWERAPGQIIGAMMAGKGPPALITGTIQGNHVVAGPIDATVVWKTFNGQPYAWDLKGTWSGTRFDFWNDSSSTRQSLLNYPDAAAVPYDRLHDDIRANRWPAAAEDAHLVCAMSPPECGWIDAVRALAANQTLPRGDVAPWRVLVHERAGRPDLAEAAAKRDCERYSRIGCRFYLDYAKSRDEYHFICRHGQVGCEEYWGRDEMALIDAARRGDLATVQGLLAKPVNVNAGGEERLSSAVQNAAGAGSLPIVQLLVERGAKLDFPSGQNTPLFNAVWGRHVDVALFLLDHGAPMHRPDVDEALLFQAAYFNETRVVQRMLQLGEKPDQYTVPAGSALTAAVKNRNLAMVRDLLAYGADPENEERNSGGSPIDYARRLHERKILALLLAARKR